jgi:hypothetical protein
MISRYVIKIKIKVMRDGTEVGFPWSSQAKGST